MARPPKVRNGHTRSFLLRKDQMDELEAQAAALGCDPSDVLRATLDVALIAPPDEYRAQLWAALEVAWRAIRCDQVLIDALDAGWGGGPAALPIDRRYRPAQVKALRQALVLVRRLGQKAPPRGKRASGGTGPVSPDWAADAPDRLLTVLAHPGVRVVKCGPADRPVKFWAARPLCPPGKWAVAGPVGAGDEPLDRAAVAGLAALLGRGEVRDRADRAGGAWTLGFPVRVFTVVWKKMSRGG